MNKKQLSAINSFWKFNKAINNKKVQILDNGKILMANGYGVILTNNFIKNDNESEYEKIDILKIIDIYNLSTIEKKDYIITNEELKNECTNKIKTKDCEYAFNCKYIKNIISIIGKCTYDIVKLSDWCMALKFTNKNTGDMAILICVKVY